jgi:hypothetical protein
MLHIELLADPVRTDRTDNSEVPQRDRQTDTEENNKIDQFEYDRYLQQCRDNAHTNRIYRVTDDPYHLIQRAVSALHQLILYFESIMKCPPYNRGTIPSANLYFH